MVLHVIFLVKKKLTMYTNTLLGAKRLGLGYVLGLASSMLWGQ